MSNYPADFKRCSCCKEVKLKTEFYSNKSHSSGVGSYCIPCHKVNHREWKAKNKERVQRYRRHTRFVQKYGITLDDWDAMYEAQGGLCLLCGRASLPGNELVTDHDHESGDVRGLLHRTCNVGIGFFNEDPRLLAKAILYVTRFA